MSADTTTPRADRRLRRRPTWRHGLGALVASALIVSGGAVAPAIASFDQSVSWDDVISAQGRVDEQQRLIQEIQQEIADLDAGLAAASSKAETAGTKYSVALEASNDKAGEVTMLQGQAAGAQATADESREQAGQLAAAMASRGAGDPSLAIFTQPENADSLLYQLGTISKLSEHTAGIYNQAVAQQNTATALGEQAEIALSQLRDLEAEAKVEFDNAQATQITLQTQKNAADVRRAELLAMLGPLIDQRDVTATDYAAAEENRVEQLERESQERAQAAAAAQQAAYEEAVAEAEAAGVAPPPAPEVSPEAPAVVVPEEVATNPDGTLARPDQDGSTPNGAAKPTQPAPKPEPSEPAPRPDPGTQPDPTTEPDPVVPGPDPVVPDPVDPAPVPDPEPTTPDKPELVPYEPPQRPDIEVVPEPKPEPKPDPKPKPNPDGIMAGYHAPVLNGVVTDNYGMRLHPILGYYRMHNGLDLGVNGGTCGAPLYAVKDATVTYSGWNGGFGNHVVLDLGSGTTVSYSHIMDGGLNVYVGQQVKAGHIVAYAGTTGTSTGCHLHFELMYYGQLMDPRPWLGIIGVRYP